MYILFVLSMLSILTLMGAILRPRQVLSRPYLGLGGAGVSDFASSLPAISSDSNDKYKAFKSLYIKKSKRETEGCIILETHRTIIDAVRLGMKPKTIFLTLKALNAPLGLSLIREIENSKLISEVCYIIPDSLMNKLSDCENSQGVISIFPMSRSLSLPANLSVVLACDRVSDPGNLGTLIRTAFGLGIDAVACIGTTDPYSPKSIRSSMGTCIQVPVVLTNWTETAGYISRYQMKVFLAVLDETAKPYYEVDYTITPCMIVIGAEADGVSKEALSLPNVQKIYIPMGKHISISLNAAVAGSIIMAEVMKQRVISSSTKKDLDCLN